MLRSAGKEPETNSNAVGMAQGATIAGLEWQEGYGAFSVSESNMNRVRAYIRSQEQHHRKATFEDEFRGLLRRHGIAFDERYVWG